MTTELVASYYEVNQEVIRQIVVRDGAQLTDSFTLTGEELALAKKESEIKSRAGSIRFFGVHSIFKLCFLLRKSRVAVQIREQVGNKSRLFELHKDDLLSLDNSYVKENGIFNHLRDVFHGLFEVKREVPCGQFFIDIVVSSDETRVAIEVDEHGHSAYDVEEEGKREKFLMDHGFEVLRFNPDCEEENNVLKLINNILKIIIDKNGREEKFLGNPEGRIESNIEERYILKETRDMNKINNLLDSNRNILMTTKTVAYYYGVDLKTINNLIVDHVDELSGNGMFFNEKLKTEIFSKRAILNVGMLLDSSDIAEKMRPAFLEQQDRLEEWQKTQSIDEEKRMLLDIAYSSNSRERSEALNKYNDYQNRELKLTKKAQEKRELMMRNIKDR